MARTCSGARGRPPKLTPTLKTLAKRLIATRPLAEVAATCGVSRSTLRAWLVADGIPWRRYAMYRDADEVHEILSTMTREERGAALLMVARMMK